jgi:hypothetical protein
MASLIQLRGDTTENWELYDPVLEIKEPIIVYDIDEKTILGFKIGNGEDSYSKLPLLEVSGGSAKGAVRYDEAQELSEEEQKTARGNISALGREQAVVSQTVRGIEVVTQEAPMEQNDVIYIEVLPVEENAG